ncbi:hypothetical protein ACN267_29875 [Micromonospora sp. WMMD734]|jgi:hypothetical protein|uniref:hypothetical protein n=1 Tax=Micromonospora TaxID=1873 RepID=UPI0033D37008
MAMNVDPERQRRLRELAELHARWQATHRVDDVDFTPEGADSAQRRSPSAQAQREYMRQAREIMGLDPDTGHYRDAE